MFSAPLSLTTETAHELPSHFYEAGRDNPWVEANLPGLDVHSHLQGPCFDAAGNLWLADTPFGRVFRINGKGDWELVVKYEGWPVALAFHADGRLIIADARHGLLAFDTTSLQMAPYLTHRLAQRFRGLAAVVFARNGDLYFSDAGQSDLNEASGAVYRLDAGGSLQRLLDHLPGPGGLALSHDESVLFFAVSRDNAIWHASLLDGGVARLGKFIQLSGGSGPQGLAIDSDNNLFVAHTGLGCAWQFDKRGEPKYRIDSSRGDTTCALAFDPNDPRTLFITEAQTGSVLKAMLPMY
jgi:gluconolactonase